MCYAYEDVYNSNMDQYFRISQRSYRELVTKDKIHYPGTLVPVISQSNKQTTLSLMHWDLIPRWFYHQQPFSIEDIKKLKKSRRKVGGKVLGFSSFNARSESIHTKAAFKAPWQENRRCLLPAQSFLERPDLAGAPVNIAHKELKIATPANAFFAGIYEHWHSIRGFQITSCTILTFEASRQSFAQKLFKERAPLCLFEEEALEWVDPLTSKERIHELLTPRTDLAFELLEIH